MTSHTVGPFFFIDGQIYPFLDEASSEEDAFVADSNIGHLEFYDRLRNIGIAGALAHPDYGYWPRGRVIYDGKRNRSLVYLDPCLLKSERAKETIKEAYGLDEKTAFRRDEHYSCHNCDPSIGENEFWLALSEDKEN